MRTLQEIVESYNNGGFDVLESSEERKIISEMATIGWFQETKPNGKPTGIEFKVFVNGSEGRIPHMHIWDEATEGKQFHACIMLEEPKYFNHGSKNSRLSKKQIKALIDFLKSPDEEYSDIPVWKVLVKEWNKANRFQKKLTGLEEMPDYTKLND